MKEPKPFTLSPEYQELVQITQARVSINHEQINLPNHDPVSEKTYNRIFNELIKPNDIIINVGAGYAVDFTKQVNHLNGQLQNVCGEKNAKLIAVDINISNLSTHQDLKYITNQQHLEVVQADALELPFADNSVAGITSSNLINCPNSSISLEEQAEKFISEAYRVLVSGGFLIITSFGYKYAYDDNDVKYHNDLLEDGQILTLKQTQTILEKIGFKKISELEVENEDGGIVENKLRNFNVLLPTEEAGGFIAYKI